MDAVKEVFDRHFRRYGARRIKAELEDQGVSMGRRQIRRWMREGGLEAIQPKSFVPKTTNSRHGQGRSPNLFLERCDNQVPKAPNEVWVGDITYIPLKGGAWCYLATWTDLFSRMIVGEHLAEHMDASLVINALQKSFIRRGSPKGVIVHTDGGGQYVDAEFRKLIADNGCSQSMTRRENHYDNAFAESLFSRLKAELMNGGLFENTADAEAACFEYIHVYHNRVRRHSGLGNMSPEQFEKKAETRQTQHDKPRATPPSGDN